MLELACVLQVNRHEQAARHNGEARNARERGHVTVSSLHVWLRLRFEREKAYDSNANMITI